MTRCPSHRPKLTRKYIAFRDGVALRQSTPITGKSSRQTGAEPADPSTITSSQAFGPHHLPQPRPTRHRLGAANAALSP
jgi:hypothetical protein